MTSVADILSSHTLSLTGGELDRTPTKLPLARLDDIVPSEVHHQK